MFGWIDIDAPLWHTNTSGLAEKYNLLKTGRLKISHSKIPAIKFILGHIPTKYIRISPVWWVDKISSVLYSVSWNVYVQPTTLTISRKGYYFNYPFFNGNFDEVSS